MSSPDFSSAEDYIFICSKMCYSAQLVLELNVRKFPTQSKHVFLSVSLLEINYSPKAIDRISQICYLREILQSPEINLFVHYEYDVNWFAALDFYCNTFLNSGRKLLL